MGRLSLRGGCPVTPVARRAKSAARPPPAGNGSTAVRNSLRCTVGQGRAVGDGDMQAAVALSLLMGWEVTFAAKRAKRRDRPAVRRTNRRRRCQIRRWPDPRRRFPRERSVGRSTRTGWPPPTLPGITMDVATFDRTRANPLPIATARCPTPILSPQRSEGSTTGLAEASMAPALRGPQGRHSGAPPPGPPIQRTRRSGGCSVISVVPTNRTRPSGC